MKLNYVKRTCKSNRQELLNKALKEELEELRKMCFPWQRIDFLFDDVEIKERDFYKEDTKESTAGLYQYDEKECKHTIYIDKLQILNVQKISLSYYRKQNYEDLRQVIKHELIHAFVKERWEYKCKTYITGKERDASPIFLAILYFCGGYTNHDCRKAFYKTELYEFAKYEVDTYKELENYLIDYLLKYMEAIGKIKEFTNRDKFIKQEEKDYWTINNTFQFAPRITGMEKFSEVVEEDLFKKDGEIKKCKSINREWHIGCNVEPHKIIELYNRKQDCKAKYYSNKKQLIVVPKCAEKKEVDVKDCKFITIKESKNY